ncbi:PA2928 family protein [Saccharothrix australiensis]|uniref:Uncharacterized protein n=1 Tax=Saccharothrix australiensis TaxID=2072 RepID=A0A495W2C1_9PSEU|nr:PA2928 family protein [Saccharothrix australiensis]RKT55792.1 hypothetical protein C8E97_4479 [Saccharothrix australiensis]
MTTKGPDGMYPPYQTPQPYQVPSLHQPVAPYETPRVRRRAPLLLLLPTLLFAVLFFGGSYLLAPEADVRVQPDPGVASVDGRDVLLVPYERHGARGMFQLMARDMFQVRLAALDAASGDVRWDTQLSDELVWQASVLASGQRYTYLATDGGLVVLDLADGSTVAEGDGVEGLGDAFVAARWAYRYDPDNRRVVVMNGHGGVLTIALDTAAATPADPRTAATWAGVLSERALPTTPPGPVTAADVPDGRVELRPRPGGAPGHVLVRTGPGGGPEPVGDVVFHGAGLVVDGTAAAGFPTGHVLVVHSRDLNDRERSISAVSLATGRVTGSVPIDSTTFSRATARGDGTAAVGVGSAVVLLTPDGRLTARPVGTTDLFGNAS